MTTLEILQEVKYVMYEKENFKSIRTIKIIYTIIYIVLSVLFMYAITESPRLFVMLAEASGAEEVAIEDISNVPFYLKIIFTGIIAAMFCVPYYFLLRFNPPCAPLNNRSYGAGKCVWRYIVAGIMTFLFIVLIFVPDGPDLVLTDAIKEIEVGGIVFTLSGIKLFLSIIISALSVHIFFVILWNCNIRHIADKKIIPEFQMKIKNYLGEDLNDTIIKDILYCFFAYEDKIRENPNLKLLTVYNQLEEEREKSRREEEERKERERQEEEDRKNEERWREERWRNDTYKERLLDEVKDLEREVRDLNDKLDRYK